MLDGMRDSMRDFTTSLRAAVSTAARRVIINVGGDKSDTVTRASSSSRSKPINYTSPLAKLVLSSFAGLGTSHGRFFVDLAANHPTYGSSSFELEEQGWSGLCIEPNPAYATMLRAQRKCSVAQTVVEAAVRNVTFRFAGEMGGIEDRKYDNQPKADIRPGARKGGSRVRCDGLKDIAMCSYLDGRKPGLCELHRVGTAPCVQAHLVMPGRSSKQCRRDNSKASACILAGKPTQASSNAPSGVLTTAPLEEVLRAHGAPHIIDYFSLDVEGSESAVFSRGFDW